MSSCLRNHFAKDVLLDGRFETIAPLNHGSFGMVFMARDHLTNGVVAIKCLTKQSAPDEAGVGLAVDDKSEELAMHCLLGSHHNIVNLVHSFETNAHVYLVLEFCSRGDLYEAIRSGQGPLETEKVRHFMLELVDAVSYMHSKGVYHRDIKPENIFLTQSGRMKLGDFGLATTEEWTTEAAVGSDRYMSPEQYDSAGAGYSPRQADVWAVGICLLNILFSRNPFTTPTEADPLFLDFSRDKQSLFDVFPTMSQDTYEVIVQCMSLDPRKRSLACTRAALVRVVNFTTTEESLDDFCSNDRHVGASLNREPLRTPSLQPAGQLEHCAFPWLKGLQASQPRPIGRLGTIPDNEMYTEELFPTSEDSSADWFSAAGQTPSASSVLESQLGASANYLAAAGRPMNSPAQRPISSRVMTPTAGSLPIRMSKPRAVVFSSPSVPKQGFSKSWSEMLEEDLEEEEAEERARQLHALNSRTWSHESRDGGINPVLFVGSQPGGVEVAGHGDDIDDLVEGGFFLHDSAPFKSAVPAEAAPQQDQQQQHDARRGDLDKWAALGERRRAYTGNSDSEKSPGLPDRRHVGVALGSSNGAAWDHNQKSTKDRTRGDRTSFNRAREWNWRRDHRRADQGDVEWVGGC